jgi:sodium-dependent phosphate cotransporter
MLGKDSSEKLFDVSDNPVSDLMIGILATVLVQSSSTTTSIIVGMVGANELSVTNAIYMIMGANIGTSVTNTIVSLAHMTDGDEYERAFSAATIHDLFNYLSVLVLFPLEWAAHPLELMTGEMVRDVVECTGDCEAWEGPVKRYITPFSKGLMGVFEDEWGMDSNATAWLSIGLSLIMTFNVLFMISKSMSYVMEGKPTELLQKSLDFNNYLTILMGLGFTILVQSSSITTSVLTPLCATDMVKLEQMFPLTVGANLGTTVTGLLASTTAVSNAKSALQVALCHMFFNVFGTIIWYVPPPLREAPIWGAKKLGELAKEYKYFPIAYIGTAFVGLPLAVYGISMSF